MPTPNTPAKQTPDSADLTPEESLKLAWDKYGNLVYIFFGIAALIIIAKGGWGYINTQKELGIQAEYLACTTPDSYLSFAAKHPGHPLAGVAEETVADNSYSSGKYLDALKAYSSAVTDLPAGPIRSHAKLGQAMSLELTGRTGEAEAALQALVDDTAELKAVRCEAGYHLAGLEAASGRTGDVEKISDQLMKIDPESAFAEKAFMLRATAAAAPAPGSVTVPSVVVPKAP